jgi:tetratricopeptide (TPR) repeat protein
VDDDMLEAFAAAESLREQGRDDEAEATLRQLVLDRPGSVAPVVALSLHLTHVGRSGEALEILEGRQRSLEEPSTAILEGLAATHGALEQWDQSIEVLLELRRVHTAADDLPGQAHFAGALAVAYESAGRLEEAESCLLEICERLQPGDDAAYYALIDFYERNGRDEEAVEARGLQQRIRHEYANPITRRHYRQLMETLDTRGIAHVAVQYPMRRIESLQRLLGHDPRPHYVDLHFIAELVERDGYETYFIDSFAGDFGHMTDLGNVLMAEAIARALVEDVLGLPFDADWRSRKTPQ